MKAEDGLGLLIVGDKPKKGEDAEGGEDEALDLASSAFLKAITRKDPKALGAAFKQMMECCDDDMHEEEKDESEDDDY